MDSHTACRFRTTIRPARSGSRFVVARCRAARPAMRQPRPAHGRTPAWKPLARSACARSLRISRTEMLQHHEIFAVAAIFDRDAVPRRIRADEQLVLCHLAEANQAGCL